jgi:hypothetical protein
MLRLPWCRIGAETAVERGKSKLEPRIELTPAPKLLAKRRWNGRRNGRETATVIVPILTPRSEGANWGAACHTFPLAFPSLKSLTLLGTPTNLLLLLPHLPSSLEHIVLDAQHGIPGAPHGTVHLWRLIPALQQGFRIGVEGTASPEVTVLGGAEGPTGWSDAVRIAAGMGVRLSREVIKGSGHHTEDWIAGS